MNKYDEKEVVVFDLDGTLVKSKGYLDKEMAKLLKDLLKIKKVAVISGGLYSQMKKSILAELNLKENLLSNLFLFPTDASCFYRYLNGEWQEVYKEKLTQEERKLIIEILEKSLSEAKYQKPNIIYGDIIEDRGTQVTFSGLGKDAPLEEKVKWDSDRVLRKNIVKIFKNYTSNFDAKIGGSTSIDINKKGINKAYGIKQIEKLLNIPLDKILFIGDALFEGGNDYPVINTGVDTIAVKNPEETKEHIKNILN